MERFLRASPRDGFPPFYAGIVGAQRCVRRPARCDLSRGIETDARARTITIRLTAPGRGVPAQAHAAVRVRRARRQPAPRHDRACAPPGTGPYRVAAWDAQARRACSSATRTSGRPPARARPASPTGSRSSVTATGRSRRRSPRSSAAAADRDGRREPVRQLRRRRAVCGRSSARAPGRVHSDPRADLGLDVPERPAAARSTTSASGARSTSRSTARASSSSPAARRPAGPTCQILPPAFPGYAPYCPYTADPSRGRGWTAPDLERARRLVAASGRAGARVTVHVPGGAGAAPARYFAPLLRDLGFRARLHVLPCGRRLLRGRPAARLAQADGRGTAGAPDYLSASTLLAPDFGCTARHDPKLHERLARVRRTAGRGDRPRRAQPPRRTPRRRGQPSIAASSTSPRPCLTSTRASSSSSRSGSATSPSTRCTTPARPDVGPLRRL